MKKILALLMLLAAPVLASVTFTATDNTDGTVTIGYTATAGDEPVGMALAVDCSVGQIDAIVSIDSFFDIFLDYAHDIEPYCYGCGSSNPNNAAAKCSGPGVQTLPSSCFVISIGGLGGATAPLTPAPSSGSIVLQCSAGVSFTISADSLRGGVVDKAGTVTTNLPILFENGICLGDMDGSGDITFDDLIFLLDLLGSHDWYVGPEDPDWNPAGDMDGSGDITFDDLLMLLDSLELYGWYIDCGGGWW